MSCSCPESRKRRCRKGRPLCRRTDNPRNVTCNCGGYHFPHRMGSKLCTAHPDFNSAMNAILYGKAS